jgi:hypothetical protein
MDRATQDQIIERNNQLTREIHRHKIMIGVFSGVFAGIVLLEFAYPEVSPSTRLMLESLPLLGIAAVSLLWLLDKNELQKNIANIQEYNKQHPDD